MKRRTAIVVYDGIQALDLVGPMDVLVAANEWLEHHRSHAIAYEVVVIGPPGGHVRAESGLRLFADAAWTAVTTTDWHTVLVVGGRGVHEAAADGRLTAWLSAAAGSADRIASVCTGVFLLAAAGVVDHERVTTHWARAARLADAHPELDIHADALYVRDGTTWTSAGVAAGMDLTLALVAEDHGQECARAAARQLVLHAHRSGGQSQFAPALWARAPEDPSIARLLDVLRDAPGAPHTVASMADVAGVSPRTLSRRFPVEVGMTPLQYLLRLRIDAARTALESTDAPVDAVARTCGFGSAESMRRHFLTIVGLTPSAHRDRFTTPHPRATSETHP